MINTWYGVILVLSMSLLVYFILGYGALFLFKLDASYFFMTITGFIVTIFVFQLINLPAEFLNWKLATLMNIYFFIISIIFVCSLGVCVSKRSRIMDDIRKGKKQWKYVFALFLVIVVQVFQVWSNGALGSVMDSSTYTGYAVAAVQTGRLNRTDVYSGLERSFNFLEALISTDIHAATICKLIGMHPLIYIGRVLGGIEVVLYNLCILEISKIIFNNRTKQLMTLMFVFAINLGMGTIYTAATFMLNRAGEPKSMTANVGIPIMILVLSLLVQNIQKKSYWIYLVFSEIVVLSFSQSGWILVPVIITVILLPSIFRERKFLFNYVLSMIPSFFAVFLMFKWRV